MRFARTLHRLAQQAGFGDFSARRATELVARSIVRKDDTDVLEVLANQPDPNWSEPLDIEARKEFRALERAVRRADVGDGLPPRAPGRKKVCRHPPSDTSPDPDLRAEQDALDLAAIDDGLDAIALPVRLALDTTIAVTEIAEMDTAQVSARD